MYYKNMLPSYRNQSIDLLCKSTDCFLYEGNIFLQNIAATTEAYQNVFWKLIWNFQDNQGQNQLFKQNKGHSQTFQYGKLLSSIFQGFPEVWSPWIMLAVHRPCSITESFGSSASFLRMWEINPIARYQDLVHKASCSATTLNQDFNVSYLHVFRTLKIFTMR